MKRKLIYLGILTVIALLAVRIFSSAERVPGTATANDLLLPEISQKINNVNRVEIVTAGNSTVATMTRADNRWKLEQLDGYRADWSKLQALLAGLASARIVESKTDKPDYYPRLGVEDVDTQEATGVLVKLGIDDHTTGILIGHAAQGREGQYIRLQGDATAALIDRGLEISTEPLGWADSSIIDINSSEVAEVEIIHPGGERVLVTKTSAEQSDFDLVGLPQGREIKNSWTLNSLGSVFSILELKSVQPDKDMDWQDAVKIRLLMFSGVEVIADALQAGDTHLVRLRASHPAATVTSGESDAPENTVDDSAAQQEIEQRAAVEVANSVEEINQRVNGWTYGIEKYKYDVLVKKPEDLLKPLESG